MLKSKDDRSEVGSDEIIAFLGKGTEFKGVISYEGTVRIDGKIEGEVITKGTLVVGETAQVDAEISAGTVVCGGKITGNINASTKVHLIAPAVLSGSVKTPILIIDEGVKFNGNCDMGKTESSTGSGPATAIPSRERVEHRREPAGKLG